VDELYVRLLYPKTGQLLREHVRQKRGRYRKLKAGQRTLTSYPGRRPDVGSGLLTD